jgi:RNA polymerase sigma-70 factor, ECF subfamily
MIWMNQAEDLVLLHRIATGDTVALSSFYDFYSRLVYSVSLQILADKELAEEVVQEVFLLVWKKAETYDPAQGKVATWIASISRHRAIDQYRRLNIRAEGHSVGWDECCTEKPDNETNIEPGIITSEQHRTMLQALDDLPDEQKEVISLAYFKGMTQQEIAVYLKEPLGTVKTRIRLGLQKLRTSLSLTLESTD